MAITRTSKRTTLETTKSDDDEQKNTQNNKKQKQPPLTHLHTATKAVCCQTIYARLKTTAFGITIASTVLTWTLYLGTTVMMEMVQQLLL
jgi:hypothetical protein